MMTKNRSLAVVATLMVLQGVSPVVGSAQASTYDFTAVNETGSNYTVATGVNAAGQIVGYDSTGSSFVDTNGKFVAISAPGSGSTYVFVSAINDVGQTAGTYVDVNGNNHGFVDTNGTFTILDAPGSANGSTNLNGLNNSGQTVGFYGTAAGYQAFVESSGMFTPITASGESGDLAFGINNIGQIVGYYIDAGGTNHGYVDTNGTLITFDAPGASSTHIYSINDTGQAVGTYHDATGAAHGFVEVDGVFTTLDAPGANRTDAYGINDAGEVVGSYQDATGTHGFIAVNAMTAVPEPASATVLGLSLVGLAFVKLRRTVA